MKKTVAILASVMLGAIAAIASTPLQISITPDVAVFSRMTRVEGLSLSIWGENPQSALALGVVNGSSGSSAGISLALLLNYADSYKGLQVAPVNYNTGDFLGWQAGFVNYTDGTMRGLQTGWVNYAGRLTGLQFGIVNFADTADNGVQIGLVNILPQNAWMSDLPDGLAPGMVFLNWRF